MKSRHHAPRGWTGRLWRLCALAVAGLALVVTPPARAQAVDPVDELENALEQDLDNLPFPDEKDRAAVYTAILEHRQKTLTALSDRIITLRDLSRALRLKDSETLRNRKNRDKKLVDVDRAVYEKLAQRFVAAYKKGVESKDATVQQALATLAGNLVTGTVAEHRELVTNLVLRDLIPELAKLAEVDDAGVQEAVARSLGSIVLELKDRLTPRANDQIRTTLVRLQKAKSPAPRLAVIEAVGGLVKLFNPDAGEESYQPRPAAREDLVTLLTLIPILFEGVRDSDPATHRRAIVVLYRLADMLSRDRQALIVTPALAPIPPGRKPTEKEIEFIRKNQAALKQEIDLLRPRLTPVVSQADYYAQAIVAADLDERFAALRTLEQLAILQDYITDRVITLPDDKPEDRPGTLFEPLFDKVNANLVKSMSDPNPRVRLLAIQVLEARGLAARVNGAALVARLSDSDPFVRWVAARTLSRLRNKPVDGAVAGLAQLLRDTDISVRIAAANALEALGPEAGAAVPALLASATVGDAEYREAGLRALGATGPFVPGTLISAEKRGKTIVPVLAAQLADSDVRVRRAAAQAIGAFGNDARLAADALKKALSDEDGDVRRLAGEALLATTK